MKKKSALMLFFALTFFVVHASDEATIWKEKFNQSLDSALSSQPLTLHKSLLASYRERLDRTVLANGNPEEAARRAATLVVQLETDIRSGLAIGEAGARFMQSVRMMNRYENNDTGLQMLARVRSRSDSEQGICRGSGYSGSGNGPGSSAMLASGRTGKGR